MKLKIYTLLILCLLLSVQTVQADNFEQGSIQATATVIPMLGIRHSSDYSQALLITEKYDSEICIQAPKNSELFISLINSRKKIHTEIILGEEQSLLINDKRSVIDIIPIELPEFGTKKRQMNIITVMRIDN